MNSPESLAALLQLTPALIDERTFALGLDTAARTRLRAARPGAAARVDGFIDRLYDRLAQVPATAGLLTNRQRVERLKGHQKEYLGELLGADLDWPYVLRRLWIGVVHHHVGLTPQWYLTTYAHILCEHVDLFFANAPDAATALDWTRTLLRTVFFDAMLAVDAYGRVREAALWDGAARHEESGDIAPAHDATAPAQPVASSPAVQRIPLTREESDLRRAFIGLTPDDVQHLRALQPLVEAHAERVVDEFYTFTAGVPELARLLPEAVAGRLRQLLAAYWSELVTGAFDRPYAASRMRIGVMHEQVGLGTGWYLVGLARQLTGFIDAMDAQAPATPARIQALIRAAFFDLSFVIDAYMQARADTLLRTEGYASQLVAGLSAGVAVVDSNNRLVSANRTMVSFAGGEAAVLYLMPIERALPIPEVADVVRAVRSSRDATAAPRASRLGTLGERRLRLTAMGLAGATGSLEGAIAVVADDVTDLFRLSQDLDQQRDHFDHLPEGVGLLLWELDVLSWTITAINGAADELTGFRDVHFLGRPSAWIERIVDADRSRFVARVAALRQGERCEIEYRMRRADDSEIWVRSWICIGRRAAPHILAAATVDVTARRRSEQLRLEALASIAGGVAHVVNNALTGVIGGIEMHARERGGLDQAPMLRLALDSTRQAATTSTQLLAFAGQQPLHNEELSLSEVTREALPMLRALLGDSVSIALDIDSDLWLCRADRRMLIRSLECLADNTRQAMGSTGTFRVVTRNRHGRDIIDQAVDPGQDWVEWRVSDNGPGMSESVRRQAIHPFFSTRSLAEAAGLGLSMVYGFVTQLGGHLLIESALGHGTTITMRLPRCAADEPLSHPAQAPLVLLVEDQVEIRRVTAVMIKALGYRVADTSSVEDARRVADILNPDILVTDVVLAQGTDGVTLATQLVATHPRLAVIVMSGYSRLSLEPGNLPPTFQFMPKPFTLEELETCLRGTPYPPAAV